MERRVFLQGILLATAGASVPEAFAMTFDEYKALQSKQFDNYQARFRAAQLVYQQEIKQYWLDAKLSSGSEFVSYSSDLLVRSAVDYKAGTVTIEAQGASPAEAGSKIRQEVERLLNLDTREAYKDDAILQLVDRDQIEKNAEQLTAEPILSDLFVGKSAGDILKPAEKSIVEDRRPVARVVIQLPEGSTATKAKRYQPLAEEYADEQKVSAALVMAVMHTESYFNPMARSHIPAFGLMQIVPQSAGLDTTEYLSGRSRLLTASELYQPKINVRSGAAYLHLLYYRYLRLIDDPLSRLYCAVAAYNTGAGNVARAFTGATSVRGAAARINRLQPQQVYSHLKRNLPYQETRNYLGKVVSRMALYSA